MTSLQKKSINYPKLLEKRIEELEAKLSFANKSIETLVSIFKVDKSCFYFTGKFKKGKIYWKDRIRAECGFVTSKPTYYTTYCVCNDFTTKISKKCRDEIGLICITENQLEWLLDNV